MSGYTAFLLPGAERRRLLGLIPPRYPAVKADHATHRYGVSGFADLPVPGVIEITAVADDGRGLQALCVTVDGRAGRPDGSFYHITWSLDPCGIVPDEFLTPEDRAAAGPAFYRPVHSNALIADVMNNPQSRFCFRALVPPVRIDAAPAFVGGKKAGGGRDVRFLRTHSPGRTPPGP